VALPKLQKLWIQGRLDDSYPELNLNGLQNHVKRTGQRRHERQRDWRTATEGNVARTETGVQPRKSEVHLSDSEKSHLRSIISGQEEQPKCHLFSGSERSENKRTWRKPRQPEDPPPNAASSSSGGNPVKLEPGAVFPDHKEELDELSDASEFTVLDSDESGASIFGLRSAIHEVEEGDELSDASSQGDDEMAVADRERVNRWRKDNLLLDDLDFAYVFANFEEPSQA
jgi:hypothetical protein